MQRKLDVDFYSSFYGVSGTEQEIRNHYATIGATKQLFPNKDCYAKVLSIVLNFDFDVFMSNGALDLSKRLIRDNHLKAHSDGNLNYFLDIFYGNIMNSIVGNNGQLNANVMRFINGIDIMQYESKWVNLLNLIKKMFNFDEEFYLFFYKNIKDPSQPLLDWLSDGIFKGKYPNLNSYNLSQNCLSELSVFLNSAGIDLNYIVKTYKDSSVNAGLLPSLSSLSDFELPIYIFTNIVKSKRLFWSPSHKQSYVDEHQRKFTNAVKYLQSMNHYDETDLNKIIVANGKIHQVFIQKEVKLNTQQIKYKMSNALALLAKILDNKFITTYTNINKLSELSRPDLMHNLIESLMSNVVDYSDDELKSMDFKSFVLSFFYNSMLPLKDGKSKEDYMTMVIGETIKFLTQFLSNKGMLVDTLEMDISSLVKNKKFIKTTKLLTKVAYLGLSLLV